MTGWPHMNMLCRMTEIVEVGRAGGVEAPYEFGLTTLEDHGSQAVERLFGALQQGQGAPVLEQIGRLREAQGLVRSEMARLAQVQPLDQPALRQLGRSIHGLAEQAEVLILAMVQRGGAEALVNLVEEIFDSFRDAERLIEIALRRGRLRVAPGPCVSA